MKKISYSELCDLIERKSHQDSTVLLTIHFFTPEDAFNQSFVESALINSITTVHGSVGSQILQVSLKGINLYSRTARLQLDNM